VGNGDLTLSQIGATGQPASTCGISIQPTSVSMPAAGGGSAVAVTTDPGCAWTALSQAPWITMTPPASGSGSGSAAFTVAANASTNARSGTITIGGATLTVNQAAACAPATINPSSQSFAGGGGAGTPVTVTAAAGCGWISTSNAPWLTITAGASGTGNGTVGFSVAPNTTTNRTGTLTIASQTFTVNQTACTFEIDRTAQTIGSDGGAGFPIPVRTQAGCPWTSTANVNWLHITSGATGIGNDNVTFIVDSSGNESRVGTLTVAGLTSIVSQERCTATVTPGINPVSSSGGSFSVTIATQTGCRWDATSDAAWLIPDETSGIGERTVTYRVLPNPGGARTGRLTFVVSGDQETLTVTQGN
jgi:hypothetical protein